MVRLVSKSSEDGNVVAIGATRTNGNNVNDSDFGSVSIYQNDNGTWTQIGNDILGNIKWDNFGKLSITVF